MMTSDSGALRFRAATALDAEAIAALHADSWRRNYRGAYSDTFLDGEVIGDRRTVWTERLSQHRQDRFTVVVEAGGAIVGFAHVVFGEDPRWGSLLDNLHVAHDRKRQGIGTGLLAETARAVGGSAPSPALYLWVLEQNEAAQAFYEARGAKYVEREPVQPPGGDLSRLGGAPVKFRYAWPDCSCLCDPD